MHESLIFLTLFEITIIFGKQSFINAKKIFNFIKRLVNEQKVIKSLKAFQKHLSHVSRNILLSAEYSL